MTERDAAFEDGREAPLYLAAMDGQDLEVLSALVQDAIFPITEMRWQKRSRRFALLINRFRWEDLPQARRRGRNPERVQSVLVIENVLKVSSQGIERADKDVILALLAIEFRAGEDAAGEVILTLAGDGALRLSVEALEITVKDVTRPYVAPAKKAPSHPD